MTLCWCGVQRNLSIRGVQRFDNGRREGSPVI